jgi:hypothetical protein
MKKLSTAYINYMRLKDQFGTDLLILTRFTSSLIIWLYILILQVIKWMKNETRRVSLFPFRDKCHFPPNTAIFLSLLTCYFDSYIDTYLDTIVNMTPVLIWYIDNFVDIWYWWYDWYDILIFWYFNSNNPW